MNWKKLKYELSCLPEKILHPIHWYKTSKALSELLKEGKIYSIQKDGIKYYFLTEEVKEHGKT